MIGLEFDLDSMNEGIGPFRGGQASAATERRIYAAEIVVLPAAAA